jgi:hypothetical protein
MTAIVKTWPSKFPRSKVLQVFNHEFAVFYFTLGRGRPAKEIDELWYTHRGQIIGHFKVASIVRNLGDNLPKLRSLTGEVSEWQIGLMHWVAVCKPPFFPLKERLFMLGFRGWHYFAIDSYRGSLDAKVRL